jgi:2-keto-4-pentenoate hydratase
MGHPLNALAWLAQKLAEEGTPLRSGMIVMTGSMVPIQYPFTADRVLVEISGLGAAELVVT